MGNMTKNFSREEFTCHCGCGMNNIEYDLVKILQEIRDELGEPIRVNSGCRCTKHNAAVGGVRNSTHLSGKAADITSASGGKKIFAVIQKLRKEGKISNLKYYILYERKNFVHVDIGRTRSHEYEIRR